VFRRLTGRKEWQFFAVLPRADARLATAWWVALILRGVLPAIFAIATGVLVGAVQRGDSLTAPLVVAGAVFILLQVLAPIHQALSANLGDRTAAWLYDRLTDACVRPPGMGHLESPSLQSDLTVARDFDLGMTGPPLFISMDFIAAGMVEMIGGLAAAAVLFGYAWWAPPLLAGGGRVRGAGRDDRRGHGGRRAIGRAQRRQVRDQLASERLRLPRVDQVGERVAADDDHVELAVSAGSQPQQQRLVAARRLGGDRDAGADLKVGQRLGGQLRAPPDQGHGLLGGLVGTLEDVCREGPGA